MKRKLYIAAPILVVLAALVAGFLGAFNQFPAATLKAISNDSGVILYSIDPFYFLDPSQGATLKPTPGASLFHDWFIIGQTVVSDPQDRKLVTKSLRRAARGAGILDLARCFDPRHGLRATDSSGAYDVLLCFECGQARIYLPDGHTKTLPISGPSSTLNEILIAAGVQLPKQP